MVLQKKILDVYMLCVTMINRIIEHSNCTFIITYEMDFV
jgi:hypothetical protein